MKRLPPLPDLVISFKAMSPVEMKPPKVPLLVLTWCYFSALFNYVVLETLPSKLAMDQWGWSAQVTCDWWRPRNVITILFSDWSMLCSTLWRTWASSCRGRGCWAWQSSPPSDPSPGADITHFINTLDDTVSLQEV